MPEIKERQIMTNIEPTFYDAMQKVIGKEGMSASSYVRNLIIQDLLKRGEIDDKVIMIVVVGMAS